MSPTEVNANIDHGRLGQLAEEFTSLWEKLHALYLDAAIGFTSVREHVISEQTKARNFVKGSELDSEEFQDTRMFTYDNLLAESFCASSIHMTAQGNVKARNAAGGANFVTLGQLCLTTFYDFWNDHLRRQYVIAKGYLDPNESNREVQQACMREHASDDLWGDLYYLRTSIVHNQGFAISDVQKCKILKWFAPGQPISLAPEQMRILFLKLLEFRNNLFSEQFPDHAIEL